MYDTDKRQQKYLFSIISIFQDGGRSGRRHLAGVADIRLRVHEARSQYCVELSRRTDDVYGDARQTSFLFQRLFSLL